MHCTGIHLICQCELPNPSQALEGGMVDNVPFPVTYFYEPVQRTTNLDTSFMLWTHSVFVSIKAMRFRCKRLSERHCFASNKIPHTVFRVSAVAQLQKRELPNHTEEPFCGAQAAGRFGRMRKWWLSISWLLRESPMDVKRQTCQACGSRDVRNIIVREGREDQLIFVRCAKCKELVARYQLKDYYHHGKGIESYLRAHGVGGGDSARAWLDAFRKSQEQAVVGYADALAALDSAHKDV